MTSTMSLPHTYYRATRNLQLSCPPLAGKVQADVCIIGAGFTSAVAQHVNRFANDARVTHADFIEHQQTVRVRRGNRL